MQSSSLSMAQRLTLAALVAALCIRVLQVIAAHYWLPLTDTIELLHDDAFYYLAIAQNMASGAGSTFSGINQTNGYQWLWQMLTAGATWLFSLNKMQLFQLTTLSGYLCMAILGVHLLVRRKAANALFFSAIFAGLLVSAFAFREVFWHGMETTLLLLLLPAFAAWVEGQSKSRGILAVAALLPLVRLDALAMLAAAYIVMLAKGELKNWRTNRLHRFGPGIVAGLVFATYLILNQSYFGVPLPISGLVKAADAPHFANFGIIWYYLNSATGIALVLLLVAELATRQLGAPTTLRRSIVVMGIATLIQYAYYASLSGWPLWPWYLYLQAGFVAMIYGRLFILMPSLLVYKKRTQVLPWRHVIITLIVSAIATIGAARTNVVRPLAAKALTETCIHMHFCVKPPPLLRSYPAANLALLGSGLITGHTIAMGDRAGSLGYWMPSGTQLLQIEGLVETMDFLQARLTGKGEDYLAQKGIDLFVVDRENYLEMGVGAERLTVIPEPTQGRVSTKGSFPLCFKSSALMHEASSGNYSRQRVYDFSKREQCSLEAWQLMWKYEKSPFGLRRLAVSSEYGDGTTLFSRLERRDRSRLPAMERQTLTPQGKL